MLKSENKKKLIQTRVKQLILSKNLQKKSWSLDCKKAVAGVGGGLAIILFYLISFGFIEKYNLFPHSRAWKHRQNCTQVKYFLTSMLDIQWYFMGGCYVVQMKTVSIVESDGLGEKNKQR